MRIALLTPRFWPEVRRGTERHVHDLAVGLGRLGHEPVIVTSGRVPGVGRVAGVRVVRLPRPPEGRLRFDPLTGHLPFVRSALRVLRPDVVHAFAAGDAVAAGAWTRKGRPLVYTHMGIPDENDLAANPRHGARTRQAIRDCSAMIVLSAHAASECERTLARLPLVIRPGVALDRFPCGTRRTPEPTVVFVGDTTPRKRLGLLLEAWQLLRPRHPRASLVIDRRTGLQAADGVEVADMDDTARLAAILGSAWVEVLPSVSEAFGLVLAEALATGTPVVATRHGGMPEIVDDAGIGRLFTGGAAELADAIEDVFALAQRPQTRSACRARARAFDAARVAADHDALYRSLT